MSEVIRSKKFQLYSDEKILSCYLDKPRGENLHFLQVEINERGLESELQRRQSLNSKKSRHSPLYYVFYLLLLCLFLSRFSNQLSQ
jgi:hypothetical protein